MTLKNLAYTTFVAAATIAFVIGSAVPSEAAKKKKAAAAPESQPVTCVIAPAAPVCASKGGQKFTYANSCYAMKDGATGAKAGECKAGKASMKKASKKKKA
jgi:hypothetical protein